MDSEETVTFFENTLYAITFSYIYVNQLLAIYRPIYSESMYITEVV